MSDNPSMEPPLGDPANPPTISKANDGGLLATTGGWNDDVLEFHYQWQRGRGGIFHDIKRWGQSLIYDPTSLDEGYELRVIVTASNRAGTTLFASDSIPASEDS